MLKDQRAEIKQLKHRLGQGEEAARNGNVWLEDVNLGTNESTFINPFDGSTRETVPPGFISNFKDMRKAAREAVKTRVNLRKTESRVRELEVRGVGGVGGVGCGLGAVACGWACGMGGVAWAVAWAVGHAVHSRAVPWHGVDWGRLLLLCWCLVVWCVGGLVCWYVGVLV